MADLMKEIELTTAWQKVTAKSFVGQKDDKSTMELTNADIDTLPTALAGVFTERSKELFLYPAVAKGTWYARVNEGSGKLKFVEV